MNSFGIIAPLAVSLVLAATGCIAPRTGSGYAPANSASGAARTTYHGAPQDKVLWQYKTALQAIRRGDYTEAKHLLDDAILSMGGIIARDKNARKARSLFHGESRKTFIGEPYERVMAYYYRGILYWMDGEPDNARACFRSALFIDGDSEKQQYAADYALLEYLDGLATVKLGGDGADAFERAGKLSKGSPLPPYKTSANILVFLEFGAGPTKYAGGEYGELLLYAEGKSAARSAVVRVQDQTVVAPAFDDLYFQATTRGGRVMDHILANKAGFKSATDTIGDVGIVSGAVLATTQQGRRSSADEVGVGLLAFGVLNKIVSAATTPAADVRCWDNLPNFLSFAALELPAGEHVLTVEFKGAHGQTLASQTKTVMVTVPADGRDVAVFVSDKLSTPKTT